MTTQKTERQSLERGLIASVIKSGTILNIKSAYENPLFSGVYDNENSYQTKTLLCVPINSVDELNGESNIIGVMQFMNKKTTSAYQHFHAEDEENSKLFMELFAKMILKSSLYLNLGVKEKTAVDSDSDSD